MPCAEPKSAWTILVWHPGTEPARRSDGSAPQPIPVQRQSRHPPVPKVFTKARLFACVTLTCPTAIFLAGDAPDQPALSVRSPNCLQGCFTFQLRMKGQHEFSEEPCDVACWNLGRESYNESLQPPPKKLGVSPSNALAKQQLPSRRSFVATTRRYSCRSRST